MGQAESTGLFLPRLDTKQPLGGDMTDAIDDSFDQAGETVPENAWSVTRVNNEIETVLTEAADRFPQYMSVKSPISATTTSRRFSI